MQLFLQFLDVGFEMYLYRLNAQLFKLFVNVGYLPFGIFLADKSYLKILPYSVYVVLCIGSALSFVGIAPLHDVCRFCLCLDRYLTLCSFVYLPLYVGYLGIGFHPCIYSHGVAHFLLCRRQLRL